MSDEAKDAWIWKGHRDGAGLPVCICCKAMRTAGHYGDCELAALQTEAARAFAEGRDSALANAAMTAWDMGHPDVRLAINRLMPDDSPCIPVDDERYAPRAAKEGK